MRDHHEEALAAAVADAREDDGFLACILAGSVARGWELPDSDVDVILVATGEEYERRRAEWDLQYYREDVTDRADVYVDGKVVNVDFLREVAENGSEPARAAFVDTDVRYTEDPELSELVDEIPTYPEAHRVDRIETFYSQMEAYRWFVDEADKREDPYLRHHAATQLALFGGRLLLAYNRTLFPFHKWFARTLRETPEKPDGTMERFEALLDERTPEAAEAYATVIREFRDWETPEAGWPVRFLLDREWQWRDGRPALEEL
ncbi:nucleotidyltransferase domain-containing protein [Halosimplex amylolyticum]|uniref:nucleotidyltransferase domain-containing protein n=1 Tax=Halosimplex amylolyticum TaxID=3396616 RepID=UPI003F57985E